MENKRCFFIIDSLDSTFTISEIEKMSEIFEEVIVFFYLKNTEANLSNNVKLVKLFSPSRKVKVNTFFKNIGLILSILSSDLFSKNTSFAYFSKLRLRLSYLLNYLPQVENINHEYNLSKEDVFYSFFTYDFAVIPALIKKKNKEIKFITLTHGRDLYEEIEPKSRKLAFRRLIYGNADDILSVSRVGASYLLNRYPEYKNKIQPYYLGTKKINDGVLSPVPKQEIVLVSCAHVRSNKAIHLIPDLLLLLKNEKKSKIKWVHFGGLIQNDYEEFHQAILSIENEPDVKVELMGHKPVREILEFYESEPVSFFLSVSETEGLPFSMMEAASYGIPIISTDVGGCKEIVSDSNLLLSVQFNNAEFMSTYRYLEKNQEKFRKDIFNNWKNNFSNTKSLASFRSIIKSS